MQCKHVWNMCDTNVITFRIFFRSVLAFRIKQSGTQSNEMRTQTGSTRIDLLSDLGFVINFASLLPHQPDARIWAMTRHGMKNCCKVVEEFWERNWKIFHFPGSESVTEFRVEIIFVKRFIYAAKLIGVWGMRVYGNFTDTRSFMNNFPFYL